MWIYLNKELNVGCLEWQSTFSHYINGNESTNAKNTKYFDTLRINLCDWDTSIHLWICSPLSFSSAPLSTFFLPLCYTCTYLDKSTWRIKGFLFLLVLSCKASHIQMIRYHIITDNRLPFRFLACTSDCKPAFIHQLMIISFTFSSHVLTRLACERSITGFY